MKTSNAKCREFVKRREPFEGSNLRGVIENGLYVVYSYKWYPLFAYCAVFGQWFCNVDKYSVSTSKQSTQSHPGVDCVNITHAEMKKIITAGA